MSDIGQWLQGHGLGKYREIFVKNDVTLAVVPKLTEEHLEKLGVTLGHRVLLLEAAAQLSDLPHRADKAPSLVTTPSQTNGAERRQLTVMFADLVGSTELSQQLDPEDLREVNRGYQDAAKSAIERFGGYVARYMGDGVLAYFGYPAAHEDDAERAVHAGLALVRAIPEVSSPTELAVRVGIATGPVVVGDLIGEGASQESAVVGETPNLAARMEGIASRNGIAVSQLTQELTGGTFDWRDLGRIQLKGFATPVQAWQPLAAGGGQRRFDAVERIGATSFVGREQEIDLLQSRWELAESGEGQSVLVSGDAGIGKSRILLMAWDRFGPATTIQLQCSPYHVSSALFPVVQYLEFAAEFAASDSPERRYEKLQSLVAITAADSETDTLPALGGALALEVDATRSILELSPPDRKEAIFGALVEQVLAVTQAGPTLITVEDLHWADPTTLEFLERLLGETSTAPVLLLLTARPEFQVSWHGYPNSTVLVLNRFTPRQAASLVRRLAGNKNLPGDLVDQIVRQADGVPLFLEELAKGILESDALRETSTGFEFAIPPTLQDSLSARLDRMGSAKSVAQFAAVIGRDFSRDLLECVWSGDDLETKLRQLVESGLVYRRHVSRRPVYTFHHALIRDAAYESLLNRNKSEIHGSVALALEEQFPESVASEPELIALHYTRSGNVEKGLEYWRVAAKRAQSQSAHQEAVAHLDQALALVGAQHESVENHRAQTELWVAKGNSLMAGVAIASEEARNAFAAAKDHGEKSGELPQVFSATWGLWISNNHAGNFGVANRLSELLLDTANGSQDRSLILEAHHAAWTTAFCRGELSGILQHTEIGRRLYDQEEHTHHRDIYGHDPLSCSYNIRSLALTQMGRLQEADEESLRAVAFAEQLGHATSVSMAYVMAAFRQFILRNHAATGELAAQTIAYSEDKQLPSWIPFARALAAWATLVDDRSASSAADAIQQSLLAITGAGAAVLTPFLYDMLAEARLREGAVEAALVVLDECLVAVEVRQDDIWTSELHVRKASALSQLGIDANEVEREIERGLCAARRDGAHLLELRVAIAGARHSSDQGRYREALGLLNPVLGTFGGSIDSPDLAEAQTLREELRGRAIR